MPSTLCAKVRGHRQRGRLMWRGKRNWVADCMNHIWSNIIFEVIFFYCFVSASEWTAEPNISVVSFSFAFRLVVWIFFENLWIATMIIKIKFNDTYHENWYHLKKSRPKWCRHSHHHQLPSSFDNLSSVQQSHFASHDFSASSSSSLFMLSISTRRMYAQWPAFSI